MRFRINPIASAILAAFALMLAGASAAPLPLYQPKMQSDMNGGGFSITNLAGFAATNMSVTNLVVSNAYFITITGPATNQFGTGSSGSTVGTNYVTPIGSQIYPDSQGTNFWWNMGLTNAYGPVVYFSITGTNNGNFLGVTNSRQWGLLSVNFVASGADRLITIPTNLPHLSTNGLTLMGSRYGFTLTNGNEFRITLESNVTLSTLWTVIGQPISQSSFVTNIPSSTNVGTSGYVLHSLGASATYWAPALGVTNGRSDGNIIYATGTNNAKWAAAPSTGSSGTSSSIQTFYKYIGSGGEPPVVPSTAITQTIFWQLGNAQMLTMNGVLGGSVTFDDTGFTSTGSTNWETHTLTVICVQSNVPLSYPSRWIFTTAAPNNIYSNGIIVYTFSKVGSQTNTLVRADSTTNNLALSLFQSQ